MARELGRPRWLLPAVDLLVVVGAATVAVTAAGLGWSALRVGAVSPTYVREAQFLAGLVALLAWTLRNWRGRGPRRDGTGSGVQTGDDGARPRRLAAYRRLLGGPPVTADEVPGWDAYLLALGLVLVALSLGGEVLVAG